MTRSSTLTSRLFCLVVLPLLFLVPASSWSKCIEGDCLNGKGTYIYRAGKEYIGEWKDGKRHGQGTYTYPDGSKYVGEFKFGKANGQGTLTYHTGRQFTGEWKNGKPTKRRDKISAAEAQAAGSIPAESSGSPADTALPEQVADSMEEGSAADQVAEVPAEQKELRSEPETAVSVPSMENAVKPVAEKPSRPPAPTAAVADKTTTQPVAAPSAVENTAAPAIEKKMNSKVQVPDAGTVPGVPIAEQPSATAMTTEPPLAETPTPGNNKKEADLPAAKISNGDTSSSAPAVPEKVRKSVPEGPSEPMPAALATSETQAPEAETAAETGTEAPATPTDKAVSPPIVTHTPSMETAAPASQAGEEPIKPEMENPKAQEALKQATAKPLVKTETVEQKPTASSEENMAHPADASTDAEKIAAPAAEKQEIAKPVPPAPVPSVVKKMPTDSHAGTGAVAQVTKRQDEEPVKAKPAPPKEADTAPTQKPAPKIKYAKPDGEGTATFPDGSKYVGEFRNGLPHGQGISTSLFGEKYVGEFREGLPNGPGIITSPDGAKYVGEFKDGKPHGHGTYTYPDGEKYTGELKNGERNGQGTSIFPKGSTYKGEWKNGLFNGPGIFTRSDGTYYKGEWKDGRKHGQATETYPDGSKYVGEFKYGRRNGQGILTAADGSKHTGTFKDGDPVPAE